MSQRSSLLLDLKESDFHIVLDEIISTIESSVTYHYIIDLYEISDYCYPFGLKRGENARTPKPIDYITDEQYALYQLFNRGSGYSSQQRIILLDEYIIELVNFKKFIKVAIANAAAYVNTLSKYEEAFHDLPSSGLVEIEEIIKTKLTLILSYCTDLTGGGINKLMNLFKGENKIILFDEDFDNSTQDKTLKNLFDSYKGSNLTEDIYKIINDIYSTNEYNISSFEKYTRLIARKRDARVVDRIITINSILEEMFISGKLKKRQVLLYLSSTGTSRRLFDSPEFAKLFPKINGRHFNPLRNKAQLFLKTLCYTTDNLDVLKQNINELKNKIIELKKLKTEIGRENDIQMDIKQVLLKKFNYNREAFENHAVLNQFDQVKGLVSNALTILENSKSQELNKDVVPVLKALIQKGKLVHKENITRLSTLEDWLNQTKFYYYFNKAVDNIKLNKGWLSFVSKDDYIRGSVHYLPILYYGSKSNDFKRVVHDVATIIFTPLGKIVPHEVVELANNAYKTAIAFSPSLEEKLLKAFLLLLVPYSEAEDDTNLLAYHWTKSLRHAIQSPTERDDYIYFTGWVARRCGFFIESARIFREGLGLSNDARFYHGLCLAEYCMYVQEKRFAHETNSAPSNAVVRLLGCITNAEIAFSEYSKIGQVYLVGKTQGCLLNSLAFISMELYTLTGIKERLIDSRKYLVLLKEYEKDYEDFPEYLHTEAHLELREYYEINKRYSERSTVEALVKINFAFTAIVRAIDGTRRKTQTGNWQHYHELFKIIKDERDSLQLGSHGII